MAHPNTAPGSRALFVLGEKVTSTELGRMGDSAIQSVYNGLLHRLLADSAGNPRNGFVGNDCLVSISAGLTMSIAPGFGMYYDSALTGDFSPYWLPVVLPSAVTTALAAHDATNPRIDLVCIASGTLDDVSENISVKDPTTGVTSTQAANQRRKWLATVTTVTGTPAAIPAAPATPSGKIVLAEVLVPAVSGAVTVRDARPLLSFAYDDKPSVQPEMASNYIAETGAQLVVSASVGMMLAVSAGFAVIEGRTYKVKYQTVTVTAAHPTLARIDEVVVHAGGTLAVLAGTPGGAPSAISATAVRLATVAVAAAAVAIGASNITDGRIREPISVSQVRANTLTASRMSGHMRPRSANMTTAAESGNRIDVTVQAQDTDGVATADAVAFDCRVVTGTMQPGGANWALSVTGGTATSITGSDVLWIATVAGAGLATVRVQDLSGTFAGTVYLVVTPANGYFGPSFRQQLIFV